MRGGTRGEKTSAVVRLSEQGSGGREPQRLPCNRVGSAVAADVPRRCPADIKGAAANAVNKLEVGRGCRAGIPSCLNLKLITQKQNLGGRGVGWRRAGRILRLDLTLTMNGGAKTAPCSQWVAVTQWLSARHPFPIQFLIVSSAVSNRLAC